MPNSCKLSQGSFRNAFFCIRCVSQLIPSHEAAYEPWECCPEVATNSQTSDKDIRGREIITEEYPTNREWSNIPLRYPCYSLEKGSVSLRGAFV